MNDAQQLEERVRELEWLRDGFMSSIERLSSDLEQARTLLRSLYDLDDPFIRVKVREFLSKERSSNSTGSIDGT